MTINYKGYSIDVIQDKEKRIGCSNCPISYSIFKNDEEMKSDSTYDFETVKTFLQKIKEFIDNGMIGSFCDTPFLSID